MIRNILLSFLLASSVTLTVAEDVVVPGLLAEKGELMFSDDFERTELGDWKVIIPGFKVEEGVLVGTQDREDHGSVGRVYVPMKDVIVAFRFKLMGSPTFNVVFDDKNYKGSHAGHICRVAVAGKQIRLGDDKEGVMQNDIFEMRRDPARKAEADKLIVGRGAGEVWTHPTVNPAVKLYAANNDTINVSGDAERISIVDCSVLPKCTSDCQFSGK